MFNYKIIFIVLLLNSIQANAIVLTGNTEGVFEQSDGSLLSWGTPYFLIGGTQSSLKYTGFDNFSVEDGERFIIGHLAYTNGQISETSGFTDTVDKKGFNLGVDFTSPVNSLFEFNYEVSLDETKNEGNIHHNSDRMTLTAAADFNPLFLLNGEDYSFQLLGFERSPDSGEYDNFLTLQEINAGDKPIAVYAKISAVPVPSAVWLFITALSGFFISSKRRAS